MEKDPNNLRKSILEIKKNKNLSESEKNKEIQNLMNNKNIIDTDIKDTCSHYPNKNCNYFYFSCCNKFANCIRCHNELLNENKHIPDLSNSK